MIAEVGEADDLAGARPASAAVEGLQRRVAIVDRPTLERYGLEKRGHLCAPPSAAYFRTAVKHGATRRLLYAWARYVVALRTHGAEVG